MSKLNDKTRVNARERVNAYMQHAANVIKLHGQLSKGSGVGHSLSAVNMQLKPLLGAELTKQLWAADEGLNLYYWAGDHTEEITQEHVIPLGVLIKHMAQDPDLYGDPVKIRQFLRQHLTVAWVPRALDKALTSAKFGSCMPEESEWQLAGSDAMSKQSQVWGRYVELKHPEVKPPHIPGSRFMKYPRELSWGTGYRDHPTFNSGTTFE